MANEQERRPLLPRRDVADTTEVYPIIQMIRSDAMHFIDTPLTYEALIAPDLTYTLVRPLEEKYTAIQRKGNLAVVFSFLLNRAYFLRDTNLTTSALSRSRAALCEILATRTLSGHASNMLELALALTTTWPVYSGADPNLIARAREERDDDLEERLGNAIEIAIISQAKRFIKSSACQRVIDGIWSGKIVYQAQSTRSILSDTYKRNPIHFYDPHKAPLLDHYRLKVPAIRSVLEYSNFLILFILFVIAIEFNDPNTINIAEAVFMVYALGFTLEKVAAMQEHGIKVYFKGTWNGFDLAFVTLYCAYALLRLFGVYRDRLWARETGIDCLAVIAVLMFPRLAFVTLRNNLMVLSLRAMIVQFVALMLIAVFCFGGFLYALWTLSRNKAGYTVGQISWWMLDLWFGLDASGFDNAAQFHPVFGPIMMITYACLSNTLLLTVLVSILSHTFSTINDDALAEAMFRRAVSTIEGVKADSLFSYQPPVNLVAVFIMLPASYILSPRWFHKFNVFMIRTTSFPVLLLIAAYERQAKRIGAVTFNETLSAATERVFDTLPRALKRLTWFDGLMAGSGADIDAVFELDDDVEHESALEMEETPAIPPVDIRPRRQSTASRRRVSAASSVRSQNPLSQASRHPSPSPSSRKNEQTSPLPLNVPLPLPRHRVNSIVTRGLELAQSAPSPLAQLFQPLIVDDDMHHEPLDHSTTIPHVHIPDHPTSPEPPPAPTVGVVSYGPASRRRLTSIHRRTPTVGGSTIGGESFVPQTHSPLAPLGMKRFPSSGNRGIATQPLSESPDERDQSVLPGGQGSSEGKYGEQEPETAAQLEEEGSGNVWAFRLQRIEERQKRMEDLLLKLADKLGS